MLPSTDGGVFHIGSEAPVPVPIRARRTRSLPSRSTSPRHIPPSPATSRDEPRGLDDAGEGDEDYLQKLTSQLEAVNLEGQALQAAALALRSQIETDMAQLVACNDGKVMNARSQLEPSTEPAACDGTGASEGTVTSDETKVVVMSDESDDEAGEDDGEEGAVGEEVIMPFEGGPVYRGVMDDDDDDVLVYRDLSYCSSTYVSPVCSPQNHKWGSTASRTQPSSWPQKPSELAPGKRNRSFTSSQPLPPAKQLSQPTSRRTTSPLPDKVDADARRIEELKARIHEAKQRNARLVEEIEANNKILTQLREENIRLREELQSALQTRGAGAAGVERADATPLPIPSVPLSTKDAVML